MKGKERLKGTGKTALREECKREGKKVFNGKDDCTKDRGRKMVMKESLLEN